MKQLGLRTTLYSVGDIEKAKEWYAMVFRVRPYFEETFYVGFNIGGYELGLVPDKKSTIKGDNVVAYWGVDNINKAYEIFLKAGATEVEKPTNVGGEIMIATVKDLWGNCIGIVYNPEFKIRINRDKK